MEDQFEEDTEEAADEEERYWSEMTLEEAMALPGKPAKMAKRMPLRMRFRRWRRARREAAAKAPHGSG